MLLVWLLFHLNMIAQDDDFDPLLPDEPDPGNAPISDYLFLLVIAGVLYVFVLYNKNARQIEK